MSLPELSGEALEPKRLRRVLVGRPMRSGQIDETLLSEVAGAADLRLGPALLGRLRDRVGARRPRRRLRRRLRYLVFPISIAIAACWGSSSSRTGRPSGSTRRAAAPTSSRGEPRHGSRAWSRPQRCSPTTCSPSLSRSPPGSLRSRRRSLAEHAQGGLSLACLGVIVFVNLRGVRESGLLFALPTYAFVTSIFVLVAVGLAQDVFGEPATRSFPNPLPAGAGGVTRLRPARAPSPRARPRSQVSRRSRTASTPSGARRARTPRRPWRVLGAIAITLFLGVSYLAVHVHATAERYRLGRLADRAGGVPAPARWAASCTTPFRALTLPSPRPRGEHVLPGFPAALGAPGARPLRAAAVLEPRRPARLLERDARPHRAAAALLGVYKANANSLIHLYVIGVFTAFTLSQAGMVRYWQRVARTRLAAAARSSTASVRPPRASSRSS